MDHVSRLLLKVLEDRPHNSLEAFEEVSAYIKNESKPAAFSEGPASTIAWCRAVEALTGPPKPPAEGEEEAADEGDGNPDCKISNVVQEAALYEQAGLGAGLSRQNAVRLYCGMKKLAGSDPSLTSVRLFGVIFGTKRDYLICEGQYGEDYTEPEEEPEPEPEDGEEEDAPKPPPPLPAEPIGQGANKYVYYVSDYDGSMNSLDKWVKLPKCRPECVMAARKIKKLFTGDLEAPVTSYPPFPGVEKDYLRAQIGRIAAGATACVKNMFIKDEEDEEGKAVKPNDPNWEEGQPGFVPLKAVELASITNWVHHPSYPSLLSKMGRCVEPEREEVDEEEAAKLPPQEQGEELCKGMDSDKAVSAYVPAWFGCSATPALGEHSASVLRSTRWPGACCIVHTSQMVNVYVGYGHKHQEGGFQPAAPPVIPEECHVEKEQEDEPVALPPPQEEEAEE
jgi:radial spoke head protein 4A